MEEVFLEFKRLFEIRYNQISVLNMGEDSVRYDFFTALQKIKGLEPWQLQLEYPLHENSFIPNLKKGSKRNEKPQVDLWVNEPDIKLCVEFGMFRRNSNDKGDIAVTENTIKMLNDFIRVALHSHCASCEGYFVCIADAKMLDYQLLKSKALPAFPGKQYKFNYSVVESLINMYKSAKKFDMRFVNRKKELALDITSDLVFCDQVMSQTNPLKTLALVWKVNADVESIS
jgi:hypothetical protein